MSTHPLNISLPETLKQYAEERVAEGSYPSTSDYIGDLIRRDRDARRRQAEARVEALLIEGLESGEPIEVTPQYWEERRLRRAAEAAHHDCASDKK
jgi:antitoxin ParD1/3/4